MLLMMLDDGWMMLDEWPILVGCVITSVSENFWVNKSHQTINILYMRCWLLRHFETTFVLVEATFGVHGIRAIQACITVAGRLGTFRLEVEEGIQQ